MTLLRLAHLNVHFFITAIAYHTGLPLARIQMLVVQVVELQLRDVEEAEVEGPVEELAVELEVALLKKTPWF
jgi:hypothetical protein